MTIIINSIWGNRISQIVDRQISQPAPNGTTSVVDFLSTKTCVVLCSNALFSISYTGIAVAHHYWMDTLIARCLAHRELHNAMIQPGSSYLSRPIHVIVDELSTNLNGYLNSDPRARGVYLKLTIVGWHLGRQPRPFSWKLVRGPQQSNGMRYFSIKHLPVGKFLREHPTALWSEIHGDTNLTVSNGIRKIEELTGLTHDHVERHFKNVIAERAKETKTVGSECIAIQLDPYNLDAPVQITRYPTSNSQNAERLMSCWLLTPGLISSPTTENTSGCTYSECGNYLLGGFSDGSTGLAVRTRLPLNTALYGGPLMLAYETQQRRPTV